MINITDVYIHTGTLYEQINSIVKYILLTPIMGPLVILIYIFQSQKGCVALSNLYSL